MADEEVFGLDDDLPDWAQDDLHDIPPEPSLAADEEEAEDVEDVP